MNRIFYIIYFVTLLPSVRPINAAEGGILISIPEGAFVPLFPDRTDNKNKLVEPIQVHSFEIQSQPVTNEDYLKFVRANPKWSKKDVGALFANEVYLNHWTSKRTYQESLESAPVIYVSWFAADAYCRSMGWRLPTTNEWEYVATFPLVVNGKRLSEIEKTKKILEWYGEPSFSEIPPIKTSSKNSLGVQGLFGLVWEWTYDFNSVLMTNDNRSNSDLKNGIFCGGGAVGSSNPEDYARFMRYAHRSSLTGRYSAANLGFRCAK